MHSVVRVCLRRGQRCLAHPDGVLRSRVSERVVVRGSSSQHTVILLPEIPREDPSVNPLLRMITEVTPDLSNVTARQCYFGFGQALLEFESTFLQMEQKCRDGVTDFDELFGPVEKARCHLESVWNSISLFHLVSDSLDRYRFAQLQARGERALNERYHSSDVYKTLVAIANDQDKKLDDESRRLLDRHLQEYRHRGFEVSSNKEEAMEKTKVTGLYKARRQYNFKMMESALRFSFSVKDPNIVRDFPVDVLKAMAVDSSQPTKGPWTVNLHPYIYRKFLEYCPERKLRWNAFQGYVSRGGSSSDKYLSVNDEINELRRSRTDQAIGLGYKSFMDLTISSKMTANVENLHVMMANLIGKAKAAQEVELESMQSYAELRGFEDDLAMFDVPYFKRKMRTTKLGIAEEGLRDFFPLPRVMTTIFRLCQDLFDIVFEEVKQDVNAWHPDTKLFRVLDEKNQVLGHFYFDPYIRDDKAYFGADKGWYIPIRPQSGKLGCKPLGAMIFTFPVAGYGKPSLLNFNEIQEIFRNMGSMLIHMLSFSQWSELTGKLSLDLDVLEMPSSFMTHWLHTPQVLTSISGHWLSNESLAPNIVQGLCETKHLMAGYELCQELFKVAYDIDFHSTDYDKESYLEIVERLHPQYMLLPMDKENAFPCYFEEIFSGNLPAAYYSSIWSSMLAADAFSAVQEVGLENMDKVRKITRRFRDTFLSKGGIVPPAELFRQFRGRDPSDDALLLSLGLTEISKPKRKGQPKEAGP